MSEKIYLQLLFLCVILCQGIFAILSDEDNRLSSDFHVRKRRVINHLPFGRIPPRIEEVNYIVKIKEDNRAVCVGTILSHRIVITPSSCVYQNVTRYQIFSGAAGNTGFNVHNITEKVKHSGNPPHEILDGITLITVDPAFEYSPKTGNIQLHLGPLPDATQLVTVCGWGRIYPIRPGAEVRMRLRRIKLTIMNHELCQNIYRGRFNISEKYICTDDEQQYCARGDAGAPLVFNDMLVGIHIWKGEHLEQRNPDVYINLQRAEYSTWIRERL